MMTTLSGNPAHPKAHIGNQHTDQKNRHENSRDRKNIFPFRLIKQMHEEQHHQHRLGNRYCHHKGPTRLERKMIPPEIAIGEERRCGKHTQSHKYHQIALDIATVMIATFGCTLFGVCVLRHRRSLFQFKTGTGAETKRSRQYPQSASKGQYSLYVRTDAHRDEQTGTVRKRSAQPTRESHGLP